MRVSAAGTLLCAAADAGSATYCSDTKADYVGAHAIDTTCDAGFYDI